MHVFGCLRLDTDQRVLTADGIAVELQPRAFDLLAYLVTAPGRVVSREEIQDAVWQGQVVVDNNLTVQMSLVRRALAQHGQTNAILTLPGRGYRFVAQVREERPKPAAVLTPGPQAPGRAWRGGLSGRTAAGAALALALGAAMGVSAMRSRTLPFAAHVAVEAVPDEILMAPEGFCHVDYRFRLSDPGELQLTTEDVRFHLTSGEPISLPSIRGRIYHGSFPIRGPGVGIYHNNLYLPGNIVVAARANGHNDVYLRHLFHLEDPQGHEVSVPAVVRIVFGASAEACTPVR